MAGGKLFNGDESSIENNVSDSDNEIAVGGKMFDHVKTVGENKIKTKVIAVKAVILNEKMDKYSTNNSKLFMAILVTTAVAIIILSVYLGLTNR